MPHNDTAPTVGFITEDGVTYAGKHLLIDAYNCRYTPDMSTLETMMVEACKATGATVLFHHAHLFNGGGSSGVVILAESHGSWHQWVEENFVAIDIFVCGKCDPEKALGIIAECLVPERMALRLEKRGVV